MDGCIHIVIETLTDDIIWLFLKGIEYANIPVSS